jgi:nicotinate-nucleotide pyrophosphorylase (carboxylating)
MSKANEQYRPFNDQEDFSQYVSAQVKAALSEDIGDGDLTAALVPHDQIEEATIIVRELAVICGVAWATACFKQVDENIDIEWLVQDGDKVVPDQLLCKMKGLARSLLTAERCALNFLQTLSGTATETNHYAAAIADTKATVLDTRKTIPLFRLAQKYAVNVGGGANQRIALYDGILIKENHIAAAGSIANVLKEAFALDAKTPKDISIQIEVENMVQLKQALNAGAPSVLLDNFSVEALKAAVILNEQSDKPALLEASGGITLDSIREIALTGVDRISTGALTKHVQAIDLSMRFVSAND